MDDEPIRPWVNDPRPAPTNQGMLDSEREHLQPDGRFDGIVPMPDLAQRDSVEFEPPRDHAPDAIPPPAVPTPEQAADIRRRMDQLLGPSDPYRHPENFVYMVLYGYDQITGAVYRSREGAAAALEAWLVEESDRCARLGISDPDADLTNIVALDVLP